MSFSMQDLSGQPDQKSQPTASPAPTPSTTPAPQAPAAPGAFSMNDLGSTQNQPQPSPAPSPEGTIDRWKREAYETVGKMLPQAAIGPTMQSVKSYWVDDFVRAASLGGKITKNLVMDFMNKLDAEDEEEETGKPEVIPAYAKGLENVYRREKAKQERPIGTGIVGGLSELGGQIISDPRNWPFLAKQIGTKVGAVAVSELAPWAEKLLAKGFGLQMTTGAASEIQQLKSDWPNLSQEEKSEAITKIIAGTYMAQSQLREGFKGAPKTADVPAENGTNLGEKTTLRPTTVTTAGVESPISAEQRATLAGEKPSVATRVAKELTSPNAEQKFGKNQVVPAATRQAVSTIGQVAEDAVARHEAIVNGDAEPEQKAGTQTPSKHENLDEMWQAMQDSAQNTTFKKADAISQRELDAWEKQKAAAIAEYKGFVDQHNDLVDRYNSQLGEGETAQQRADFDPEDVAVPEKPLTYNELRAEIQRQQALAGPSSPADVRDEAINKGLPKAEKAMDSWFGKHSDEISPAEYESSKKLWADSMRIKDMAMQLRGPITQGNLTGRAMRNVEVQMNNKQLRRGQAPDAFRRLMGPEGYENWRNVAKLFDTVKDPSLPEQFQSWGKYAAEYLASAVLPHLYGAGVVAKWGVEQVLNHTMFDPEFGQTFGKLVDWLKQSSLGGAVDSIKSLPETLRDKFTSLVKSYQDSKLSSERGAAGNSISQGNTPETNKFGRAGLGGGSFSSEDLQATVKDEFSPVGHDEYSAALRANPQAATLTDPEAMTENRKFSDGKGVYYSISPDGDLQGVVNNSGTPGALKRVMPHAIANGAKTLDAWDLYLPKQYEKYGFERTKSTPYDVASYGEPSENLKDSWKQQGWKEGDKYPSVQYMKLKDAAVTTDALKAEYGTTNDVHKAGFILPEGDMIPLVGEHDHMLGGKTTENTREQFIKDSGAIRTRYRMSRAGEEQVFSLPSEITEGQARQIRYAASSLKNGRVVLETVEGKKSQSLDFPTASKTQKALESLVKIKPEASEGVTGSNQHGEGMEYRNDNSGTTNLQHTVTTTDANGNKIGELAAQDTAPKEVTVRSNQVYDPAMRGAGRGPDQLRHLLSSVSDDTTRVKSDISTTGAARGAWEKLVKENPDAVTKKSYPNGQVQYSVDMDKWRSGPDLDSKEITTRRPTSVSGDTGNNQGQYADREAIEQADRNKPSGQTGSGTPKMGYKEKLARTVAQYEGINYSPEDLASPDKTINKFVDHVSSNLEWLYNQIPDSIRNQTRQWYDSAHTLTKNLGKQYGFSHEQAAGVTAALSPQNPWDNNIGLAKRMMDIYRNRQDFEFSPDMEKKAADLKKVPTQSKAFRGLLKDIDGKKLKDIVNANPDVEAVQKALWIRLYDEAHGSRVNDRYAPTGEVTGHASDLRSWIGLDHASKAVKILENGSVSNINDVMGQGHKIRNFYNNIINPNSTKGHVTIDTHATAAGLMQPLGSHDLEAMHNFGGTQKGIPGPPKDASTGLGGTYPLYAEAYQRVAQKLGVLPRELQSVTWEAIKSLMGDEKKTPELKAKVKEIWQEVQDGRLTPDEARDRIKDESGGFSKPAWMSDAEWDRISEENGDTSFNPEGGK